MRRLFKWLATLDQRELALRPVRFTSSMLDACLTVIELIVWLLRLGRFLDRLPTIGPWVRKVLIGTLGIHAGESLPIFALHIDLINVVIEAFHQSILLLTSICRWSGV